MWLRPITSNFMPPPSFVALHLTSVTQPRPPESSHCGARITIVVKTEPDAEFTAHPLTAHSMTRETTILTRSPRARRTCSTSRRHTGTAYYYCGRSPGSCSDEKERVNSNNQQLFSVPSLVGQKLKFIRPRSHIDIANSLPVQRWL